MKRFLLQQGASKELHFFSHITEFGFKKNSMVQLNSFAEMAVNELCVYYIIEGKFEWTIDKQSYILYPGDLALILPGQFLGSENGYLDIGSFYWINIKMNLNRAADERPKQEDWSHFCQSEYLTLRKVLLLNKTPVISKFKKAAVVFQTLQNEIFNRELGYVVRVNQLIDELLIAITRQLSRLNISQRDFPQTFMKLEETLRQNLSHQWTVEEMAALVGLGTTAFNEKVKNYTGFSPLNYLINIRISEAIKLLKKKNVNLTDIAYETGFYSSQHFSTTFKKLTGYTPSQFRKK